MHQNSQWSNPVAVIALHLDIVHRPNLFLQESRGFDPTLLPLWAAAGNPIPPVPGRVRLGKLPETRPRTTAFTCRAGCKELDVSKNRNAGPVKSNALLCPVLANFPDS